MASEGLGSGAGPTAVLGEGEEDGAEAFRAAVAALYLLVCVTGLGGNVLVLAATLKLDRLGSAATVYIFNLALADGLFMAGLPFIAVQSFLRRWPFGDAACKAVMALDGVNQFTSVFCLTAMSVERCLALALGPGGRAARWRTPRGAKAVAGALWLLSLGPVVPVALRFSAAGGLCAMQPAASSSSSADCGRRVAFLAYTFVLGFALPFGVMLAALRRAGRAGGPEGRVTRMVVAVVLAFALCWLPFYALNLCALRQGPGPTPAFARAFELAVLLSYSWSCANPILYACLSPTFRCHFRALLCPGAPPRRHGDAVTEGYDLRDSTQGRSQV